MKKYKLIKEYPGSPKLGTECTELENDTITAYPEFWKKVIEKNYEILSFQSTTPHKNGHIIHCKQFNFEKRIDHYLKDNEWNIHSVKRLPDGEVFTIGDRVEYSINGCWNEESISFITGFSIEDKDELVILTDKSNRWSHLSNSVRKVKKQSLFTTDDGVDIFVEDTYFQLNINYYKSFRAAIYESKGRPNINYDYNTIDGKEKLNALGRYYFSTKEAAEKYILMNRPCLSIEDVKSILNPNIFYQYHTTTIQELRKLVKEKL